MSKVQSTRMEAQVLIPFSCHQFRITCSTARSGYVSCKPKFDAEESLSTRHTLYDDAHVCRPSAHHTDRRAGCPMSNAHVRISVVSCCLWARFSSPVVTIRVTRLFGVILCQVFTYLRTYNGDPRVFKSLVSIYLRLQLCVGTLTIDIRKVIAILCVIRECQVLNILTHRPIKDWRDYTYRPHKLLIVCTISWLLRMVDDDPH